MTAWDAYALLPLAGPVLAAAVLVLAPHRWLAAWQQASRRHGLALHLAAVGLGLALLLAGAAVRLTDSGLGCADWPACYGRSAPIGPRAALEGVPVGVPDRTPDGKPASASADADAWTAPARLGADRLQTALAAGVAALMAWLALLNARAARPDRLTRPGAGIGPQALALLWATGLGAWMAASAGLTRPPLAASLQLLATLALLALLGRLAARVRTDGPAHPLPAALRHLAHAGLALLMLQAALGVWVSTHEAVLACSGFPTCQGSWWPPMDFAQGFDLWHAPQLALDWAALTAIHYTHRLMAGLVLALLMALAWQLNRHKSWRAHSRVLAALIGLQLASGLGNVLLGWPLLGALLHTAGAAALVLTLSWVLAQAVAAGRRRAPGPSA